jgi:hypothetical protein
MTRRWSPVFACEREMRPHIVLTPLVLGVPACTAKSLCNTTMRSDSSMEVLYAFCEEQRWQGNGQQRRYNTKWWRAQCSILGDTDAPACLCHLSGWGRVYVHTNVYRVELLRQAKDTPTHTTEWQSATRRLCEPRARLRWHGTTCGRPARSQHAQSLPYPCPAKVFN